MILINTEHVFEIMHKICSSSGMNMPLNSLGVTTNATFNVSWISFPSCFYQFHTYIRC